jgi:hypothetical protein
MLLMIRLVSFDTNIQIVVSILLYADSSLTLLSKYCTDFSDPLRPDVYQRWANIAQKNSSVYDEIDGNMSVYRCQTINQYKTAMSQYVHRSILDSEVQMVLSEIKGFLVDWPQSLFLQEDLSPSLAARAIIPDELWV